MHCPHVVMVISNARLCVDTANNGAVCVSMPLSILPLVLRARSRYVVGGIPSDLVFVPLFLRLGSP